MKLIAAPARQFRTISFWLLIAAGIFDLAVIFARTLFDLHVMSTEALGVVNAVLAFATGAVRFVAQQIPTSTEEKAELIEAAGKAPVHDGEFDISAKIVPAVLPTPGSYP